jgi:hypothetical protein
MTINVRDTGALLAATAAATGVWLASGGVAHAAPQCADKNMSPAQCDLYTTCLAAYANSDVDDGSGWEDPGWCHRDAFLYAP